MSEGVVSDNRNLNLVEVYDLLGIADITCDEAYCCVSLVYHGHV
jgi:hypothetical protein